MFNPQMKKYQLYKPIVVKNEYNEDTYSYEYDRDVEMAIAINTHSNYTGNDSNITNAEFTAISRDRRIIKGDKIDNYIVTFVEVNRLYSIVYLKEIANVGQFKSNK